ncbi:MAG: tetratricopeptide repeat protein [Bacteroidota bacterium]
MVYLNKAIEYGPDWDALYNNRGLILQNRDDHEGAIADFNKALEHDSTAPYAYNNRGYSKILLGRFREGMKDVLKSEELDDDNAYVYRNKALFYEKTAKYSSACKWLQKRNLLFPNSEKRQT